jgi:hypothetical protein
MYTPRVRPASKRKNIFRTGDLLMLKADGILRQEQQGKLYIVLFAPDDTEFVTFQQVDEERSAVVHWTHLEKFYKVIA